MPTSTHDIFTELVSQEIGSKLKSVSRGDTDVAAVLALVRSESTSDVYLYGSMDMKPSTNVIPSTHQTPPLRTPILNIPPS